MKMTREEFINIIKLARLPLVISTLLFFTIGVLFALAEGFNFNLEEFLLGFGIVTTAIISMSYSNNYFDAEADKNNKPTAFSGGSTGLINSKKIYDLLKYLALLFMGISIFFSFLFIVLFSFPLEFFLFILVGNLLAWFYSAPPLKFAYRGVGEIVTVITVGLMLPLLGYYIFARSISFLFIFFIIPIIFLILIFILNVEIPDFESDRLGKKMNLIIKKGPQFGLKIAVISGMILFLYSFFFIIFQNDISTIIDFRVISVLSIFILGFNSISITPLFVQKYGRLKLVLNNLTSVLLVILLMNLYLFYIIVT